MSLEKQVRSQQEQASVEVNILGQKLVLRADEDPKHLERLAQFINRKADEVSAGTSVSTPKLMVLTAINIANEYFRALEEMRALKKEVSQRSKVLLEEIDALGLNLDQ
ncbi:MAG: cell division protein ZapA [Myxococcota bacterium]|nr:cell division protein ZapA [Myxococcota bacterium]